MSELIKRLITAMTLCLTALLVHAQEWTKEDSLRLRKLLDSDQELNLNQDAVRQISAALSVLPACRWKRSGCCPMSRFPKHCLNRKWY